MIIYRGIAAEVNFERQITAKGSEVEAEIMAGNNDVFVGNASLTMYPSKSNSANLNNVCSDKYRTGWICCTSDYNVARKFATANGFQRGIVLTIDVPNDIYHEISYMEHNLFVINNEESEILLDMTSFESKKIPRQWIINQDFI